MSSKTNIFIVLFLVIGAAYGAWYYLGGAECIALQIKRTDTVKGITVTGTVKSSEDTDITPEITGTIEKLYVRSGDYVENNQLVAKLDPTEALAEVETARTRLESAQAAIKKDVVDYKDSQLQVDRYQKLFDKGAVSKRDFEEKILRKEKLEKQLNEDKMQIEAARSDLELERAKQKNYMIRAPFSGYITEKFVSTGDIVSPQKAIFRIVAPENIYLSMEVEENELDSLKIDQKALVIFDAYPGRVFNEKVYYISKQVNPLSGTFEARITRPPAKELKILVGMTLDATVVVEEFENVIIIPADFVLEENNKTYVFRKTEDYAFKTEIYTKIFDNNRVLVEEGLQEGDIILRRIGKGKLKDNTKIKIKKFLK